MLKLMGKKMFTIFHSIFVCLSKPVMMIGQRSLFPIDNNEHLRDKTSNSTLSPVITSVQPEHLPSFSDLSGNCCMEKAGVLKCPLSAQQ